MNPTLCLSFDNLGEAAEVGAGARDPDGALGDHPTATGAVPAVLDELAAHGLRATFFVEGLNAELYPDLLRRIDSEGHEVAYHAWTHEQWGELSAAGQRQNLARGIAAFERIGLAPSGMRPPGGALGAGGVEILREGGLRYCSPAGHGVGVEQGVAMLPFRWRHVDATCVLPGLERVREEMTGSGEPMAPDAFLAHLEAEIARLAIGGGQATIVLHPFMLDWFGPKRLGALLDRIATALDDGLRLSPCDEVAAQLLADPASGEGFTSDPTSWRN
jgi:peptidoglycan/xylan/chitin deacetylase (PgdA/CDA1 family)